MQKNNQDIFKKVASKFNLNEAQVEEVFSSDIKSIVDNARKLDANDTSTHHVFLLPNFGKFVLNYRKAQKLKVNGTKHKSLKEDNSI